MRRPQVLLLAVSVAALAAAPIPAPVVVDGPFEPPASPLLLPAVTELDGDPAGALVTHRLHAGPGARTTFELSARAVAPADDGAPMLGPQAGDVRLPAGEVTLDPGERATIRSAVGPDAPAVIALTATPRAADGGEHQGATTDAGASTASATTAYVLTGARTSARSRPAVTARLDDGRLTVELDGGAAATIADVRVRLAAVPGPVVLDDAFADVLLLPDAPRRLVWRLDLGPWPGPYRIQVVAAADGGGPVRAEVTTWPRAGAAAGPVALVAVLAAAVVWWLRRRRGRGPDPTTPGSGA